MRLTTFSDYTIRALIYMGIFPDRMITVGELATNYGVSRNHLNKVVHYLGQQGYVETTRGKGGGIRLAVAPENINIGTLVRDTEKNSALVECFSPASCECRLVPACRLTGILRQAQESFYTVLDQYTVADLITNTEQLQGLFVSNA